MEWKKLKLCIFYIARTDKITIVITRERINVPSVYVITDRQYQGLCALIVSISGTAQNLLL